MCARVCSKWIVYIPPNGNFTGTLFLGKAIWSLRLFDYSAASRPDSLRPLVLLLSGLRHSIFVKETSEWPPLLRFQSLNLGSIAAAGFVLVIASDYLRLPK